MQFVAFSNWNEAENIFEDYNWNNSVYSGDDIFNKSGP